MLRFWRSLDFRLSAGLQCDRSAPLLPNNSLQPTHPVPHSVLSLAGSKRKVAEMYAYARSAGALDDYHNYLRSIWIDEFLRSRRRRDCDTSVDADLVRRVHRNGTNV